MPTPESRKRVTSTDVARAAGVSRATVGFVLNDTPGQVISDGTRGRVLDAALRLGYRPNSAARVLARGRSEIILLVRPDWPSTDILTRFLDRLSEIIDEAGYCLVVWAPPAGRRARPLWESLDADLVMGISLFDEEQIAELHANGIAKVFPTPGHTLDASGFTGASRLQVAHLHGLGHRRVAFARPADPRFAFLEQYHLDAVRTEAAECGVEIVAADVVDHRDGSAERAVRAWKKAGCTGVVAYNDDVAAAVVGAALRLGVEVPEGLSVIGHDDSALAGLFVPSITSVRLDVDALAHMVAAQAMHEVGGPPPPHVPPSTVTVASRESTGPPGR